MQALFILQQTEKRQVIHKSVFFCYVCPAKQDYYVSTVGLNEATIKKYIQEQENHDIAMDKLSVKEYEDPFKG